MVGIPIVGVPIIRSPNDHSQDFIPIVYELRLLLGVMMRASVRAIEERLAAREAPISALQYLIMTTLHYHPLTLSDLSRKVQLDPSTVSTAVDALVRKGYLVRGQDPRDRRRMPLSLTESGTALLRTIPGLLHDDLLVDVMKQLGPARAAALRDLLREAVLLLPDGPTILSEMQQFVAIHTDPRGSAAPQSRCGTTPDDAETPAAQDLDSNRGDRTIASTDD